MSNVSSQPSTSTEDDGVEVIAFYLPQYHPVRENDEWWGAGFTEWRNVTKAAPSFAGHYQPHRPADLGYYDLRVPETRIQQARLARHYGIHAFCYYHYWFSGRRILERPFEEVLKSGEPDFPFCLCWANENWTRTWDGGDKDILLAQRYSPTEYRAFIRDLIPAFWDERYVRVDGKPLLLVYRVDLLPEIHEAVEIWQEETIRAGLDGVYLAAVQFWDIHDPRPFGFDAAVEFPPHNFFVDTMELKQFVAFFDPECRSWCYDYEKAIRKGIDRQNEDYVLFRGAVPSWDNTARRQNTAHLFVNSSPAAFGYWLSELCAKARAKPKKSERIVFVNAWNEWGEGCHLEPDLKHGHAFLEQVRAAVSPKPATERLKTELIRAALQTQILSGEDMKLLFSRQQRTIDELAREVQRLHDIAASMPRKFG
jgi:lipopolysaccharide biosynthesis protein